MIENLNDINRETPEGKLLWAALIKISTEYEKDRTPDEIIGQLNELSFCLDVEYAKHEKMNDMSEWKKHRKTTEQELRPVTEVDIKRYHHSQADNCPEHDRWNLSVSHSDRENGSPKIGDWIARNPKSPNDQWLVSEEFYKENYEPVADLIEQLKKYQKDGKPKG